MTVVLRDYQEELIAGARAHFRARRKRVLIQLATGGGKTALASRMVRTAISKGKRVWFCCHRRELVGQISQALTKEGVPHGRVQAKVPMNIDALAQVCSIPTLINRLERLPPPDLIIFDECHHIAAENWNTIAKRYPAAHQLGLSGTPQRLDRRPLAPYFDAMVCGPSVKWLIENKFLCEYQLFAPPLILDRSSLHKRLGEFVASESASAITPKIVGKAVEHYRKYCPDKSAIGFAPSVEKSIEMSKAFNEAGIPSFHLDSNTHDDIRDDVMKDLAAGKIKSVWNVDLFGEGFDCPSLDAVIDMAPTMSMTKYRQRVGRMLRPSPGKEYGIYIDCVGNSGFNGPNGFDPVHGLPDADIEWSLTDGEPEKKKNKTLSPRICPNCFAANRAGARACKICKNDFPVAGRVIDEVDGELGQVTGIDPLAAEKRGKRVEQGMAKDLAALIDLGTRRGMKNPEGWARHVLEGRQKKNGVANQRRHVELAISGTGEDSQS